MPMPTQDNTALSAAATKALADIKQAVAGFASKQDLETLQSKYAALQQQCDAIDVANKTLHHGAFASEDPLLKSLTDSDELKRIVEVGKGRAVIKLGDLNAIPMGQKAVLTGTSMTGTAGVIQPERVGPIVNLAQRRLFLRDLLWKGNKTASNTVYFVKELTFVNNASPQAGEGALKIETTNTFNTTSLPVQTIAHWLNISRQALDDAPTVADFIRTKMLYGLRYREEIEALSGDGTGNHLMGLTGQSASFNSGLLGSSYNKMDILRTALEQVELADEVPAGFFVMNPTDWAKIELTKSTQGEYIVGSPGGTASAPSLWGKPVIVSTAIAANTFLAGSSESAELIDRLDATLEISYENQDNFIRNVATLLCEERTVLVTYRPNAFVTGSLSSSPAS